MYVQHKGENPEQYCAGYPKYLVPTRPHHHPPASPALVIPVMRKARARKPRISDRDRLASRHRQLARRLPSLSSDSSALSTQASRQGFPQFAQLRRFAQYTIRVERRALIGNETPSPTRQQDDDRLWRCGLHRGADLAPVDVRHPEVRYHRMKGTTLCARRQESVDTRLAAARRNDGMAIARERVLQ